MVRRGTSRADRENWTTGYAIPEARRRGSDGGEAGGSHGGVKAQVALAALEGDKMVNELAGHYGVHPTLIHGWKKRLNAGAESVLGSPAKAASADVRV